MDTIKLYLVICALFAIGNITLSLIYFVKIKEVWRWIKIWYIVANGLVLAMVMQSFFGYRPSGEMQLLGMLVLLSSQFAGLVVSINKVNVADLLTKLEKKIDETQNQL